MYLLALIGLLCLSSGPVLSDETGLRVYTWTAFRAEDGLGHNIVTSVVETPDNVLWFATRGGGIARYDGRDWRVFTVKDGLPGNAFGSLYVAVDGVLWATGAIGHSGGRQIAKFQDHKWEAVDLPEHLAKAGVGQVVGVGNGGLCFATSGDGILHYDGAEWKTITEREGLDSNHISCMLRSKDGTVWAAYGGRRRNNGGKRRQMPGRLAGSASGVSRFDPVDKKWVRFSEFDDQAGENIMSMAEVTCPH